MAGEEAFSGEDNWEVEEEVVYAHRFGEARSTDWDSRETGQTGILY